MAVVVNSLLRTVVMAGATSAVMTSCRLWEHLWSLGDCCGDLHLAIRFLISWETAVDQVRGDDILRQDEAPWGASREHIPNSTGRCVQVFSDYGVQCHIESWAFGHWSAAQCGHLHHIQLYVYACAVHRSQMQHELQATGVNRNWCR